MFVYDGVEELAVSPAGGEVVDVDVGITEKKEKLVLVWCVHWLTVEPVLISLTETMTKSAHRLLFPLTKTK